MSNPSEDLLPISVTPRPRRILRRVLGVLFAVWVAIIAGGMILVYAVPSSANGRLASDKAAYVGTWKSETLTLRIAGDGTFEYSHSENYGNTHYGGRIRGFDSDDFTVLIPPFFPGRFHVTEPPHQVDGRWEMVVDGIRVNRNP